MALPSYTPIFLWDVPATKAQLLSKIVRDNLGFLGTLNITTDAAYPPNPRDGMPRILADDETNVVFQIYFNGAWRTIFQHIELGIPAPFKFIATIAGPGSAIWTVDHNLGGYCIVQCFDVNWREIRPSDVQQVSVNRVVITHAAAEAGFAICIG